MKLTTPIAPIRRVNHHHQMDTTCFDPRQRTVTTRWYCAFGRRPLVQVFITAEGQSERVRFAAKLDSVDGIEETAVPLLTSDGIPLSPEAALPSPTEYNFVGDLEVPAKADVRPFCVGVMCVLTALWTEALTVEQLRRSKHPQAEFYRHAMHVLGCDHPFAHVVCGAAAPADPRYDF